MRIMKLGLCIGIASTALIAGMQAPAWANGEEYLWTSGGYGLWSDDPDSAGNPGDAIKACDNTSDGWAISVSLNWGDATHYRQVDTRGHESGYCTPKWATGDIPETEYVDIKVEEVKSDGNGGLLHRNAEYFQRQA